MSDYGELRKGDLCLELIPLIPYRELTINVSTKSVLYSLSQLDPSPTTIAWIAMVNGPGNDHTVWYNWKGYLKSEDQIHFIAAHPRYYRQYVLIGGNTRLPVNMSGPDPISLCDVNPDVESNTVKHRSNLDFWWSSDQLQRDYAVILGYVTTETKDVDRDEVINIKCKYYISSGYENGNVHDVINKYIECLERAKNIPNQDISKIITNTYQKYVRTVLQLALLCDFDGESISNITRYFTSYRNEGNLLRKYGSKARMAFLHNDTIKFILGLPLQCGVNTTTLMGIMNVALSDPKKYQSKIRAYNIKRLQEYHSNLPYPTNLPSDTDKSPGSNITYNVVYDILPCYLIPYDRDGKIHYHVLGKMESTMHTEYRMEIIIRSMEDMVKDVTKLPAMNFLDTLEELSGSDYYINILQDNIVEEDEDEKN